MEFNFKCMIFKLILQNNSMDALKLLSGKSLKNLTNAMSTLVHVMACCRQAASHYLRQWWSRFMAPPSHNMLISSQRHPIARSHGNFWGWRIFFLAIEVYVLNCFYEWNIFLFWNVHKWHVLVFCIVFVGFFSVKFSKSLLRAFCVTAPILHSFTFLLNMEV